MDRSDAARVLGTLAAAYSRRLQPDQADVWFDASLRKIAADAGMTTAARIISEDEHFPTPARFNAIARGFGPRDDSAPAPLPPFPSAEKRLWLRNQIAELQTKLASDGRREHDHHQGWQNCPVCSEKETR